MRKLLQPSSNVLNWSPWNEVCDTLLGCQRFSRSTHIHDFVNATWLKIAITTFWWKKFCATFSCREFFLIMNGNRYCQQELWIRWWLSSWVMCFLAWPKMNLYIAKKTREYSSPAGTDNELSTIFNYPLKIIV